MRHPASAMIVIVLCLLACQSPTLAQSVGRFGNTIPQGRVLTLPSVTNGAPTSITQTTATLAGSVNPSGFTASAHFEYGSVAPTYPYFTPTQSLGSGTAFVTLTNGAIGTGTADDPVLTCNTTYYGRIVAVGANGTFYGNDVSFTTNACSVPPTPPTSVTGAATGTTNSTTLLHGTVNPNGSPTGGWFEWGAVSGALSNVTATQSLGAGVAPVAVSAGLSGLTGSTAYLFRMCGSNAGGMPCGSEVGFTTSADPAPGRQLLTTNDFVDDNCYYNLTTDGNDTAYSQGLTSRVVGGDFRLIFRGWNQNSFDEISLAGKNCGDTINVRTNRWQPTNIAKNSERWLGLDWDETNQKLWATMASSYTASTLNINLITYTLDGGGVAGNQHGPIGLAGLPAKRAFGSILFTPAAWQTDYSLKPVILFGGGYTSLLNQGGTASLGTTAYGIPDIAGYSAWTTQTNLNDPNNIQAADYDIYSDKSSGSTGAYAAGVRVRGLRASPFENFYDGGDARSNPLSPSFTVNTNGTAVTRAAGVAFQTWWPGYSVTAADGNVYSTGVYSVTIAGVPYQVASVASATALTLTTSAGVQSGVNMTTPNTTPLVPPKNGTAWPCPNAGLTTCYMSWGDTYWDTGFIVNGTNRYGIVHLASLLCGKAWYGNSHLNDQSMCFEIHVEDPADFAAVKAGTLSKMDQQPRVMKVITLPGLGTSSAVEAAYKMVSGATYNPATGKMYIMGNGVNSGGTNRIYRFTILDLP